MYSSPNCHSSIRRHFDTADLADRMEALFIYLLNNVNNEFYDLVQQG